MLIYIIANSAFSDFINYTIKGTLEFNNYISYKNLIKLDLIGILSVCIPIIIVIEWIKTIILDKDRKLLIILTYGMAMLVITFPISDKIHFLIGATPIIILLLYEIETSLKKIITNNRFSKGISTLLMSIIILGLIDYAFVNFYHYFKEIDNYSRLNHFRYIPISKSLENQIQEVDKFILSEESKVKILDASAVSYMIPLDRYYKDYNMLLKGNIGYQGEKKIIDEISRNQNEKYLILDNKYSKNWQTPMKIIEYVLNEKDRVGQIEIFNVYK